MYQIHEEQLFEDLSQAKFFRMSAIIELIQDLDKFDRSTNKGRGLAHEFVDNFLIDKAILGFQFFNQETRFPNGKDDIFVTLFNTSTKEVFQNLITILSISNEEYKNDISELEKEIDSTLNSLLANIADYKETWTQPKFESKINCVWE